MQNCVAVQMCFCVTGADNIRSTQTFLLAYTRARKQDLHLQKSLREVGFAGTGLFFGCFSFHPRHGDRCECYSAAYVCIEIVTGYI